jgi:hypothetical protein
MFEDNVRVDPAVRFPALAAAIAGVPVRPDRGGTAAACAADTRALLELTRALQARLHGQLACLDEQGFAEALGCATTTSWLAAYANLDRAQARRMVLSARTADRLPLLGARHGQGKIGPEHLAAVSAGAPRVPEEILRNADKTFADFSGSARPGELRLVAQRLQASYDQDAVTDDAHYAHQARRLSLARTFGDAWHLDGLLEPVDGAALDLALQSLMAPRDSEDDRTVTQRRADALIELTQLALTSGQLPATGGDRPRLTFLVTTPPSGHDEGGDDTSNDTSDDLIGAPIDIGCTHPHPNPGDGQTRDLRTGGRPVGGCHARCTGGESTAQSWPDGGSPGQSTGGATNDLQEPAHVDEVLEAGRTLSGQPRLVGGEPGVSESGEELFAGDLFGGPLFTGAEAMLAVAGFGDGITDTSAQLLGVHSLLPATTIARIGCDADINTATLNTAGDVLNYQRSRRRHSPAQGRAVVLRDQHCVFPGCDVPPPRCIIHHLEFWDHGGPTNLDHLALVCLFHHHRVHEHHWWLQRHQDHPQAPITWVATAPDGHQLRQHRQPAA